MSDLFLIAHLVRGHPAFDIAEQVECPICVAWYSSNSRYDFSCDECNDTRHWWIIPTSGHRAYPFWYIELNELMPVELIAEDAWLDTDDTVGHAFASGRIAPPKGDWPDHYPNSPAPKGSGLIFNLAALLRPKAPIKRRV